MLALVGNLPLTCGGSVRRRGRLLFRTVSAIAFYLRVLPTVLGSVSIVRTTVLATSRGNCLGTASYTSCLIRGNVPFHSTCRVAKGVLGRYRRRGLALRGFPLRVCGGRSSTFSRAVCGGISLGRYIVHEGMTNKPTPRHIGRRVRTIGAGLRSCRVVS